MPPVVTTKPPTKLSNELNLGPDNNPQYIDCFKPLNESAQQGPNLPNDGYTSTDTDTAGFTANDCVSCCLSTTNGYYAGISLTGAGTYKCTCGTKSEINGNFERWNGCAPCPGNNNQSSYNTHKGTTNVTVQSSTDVSTVSTGYTAGMTSEEKTTKVPINMGETQTKVDIAGIITIVCIRRTRGNKSNDQRTSLSSPNSSSNPSFQSPPVQLEDLYTKPNKKKKNQPPSTPTPDDPSYQDVLPSGAQHQYATVKDDPHPYTAVRDEPNLYDSIQDDPQYATVQKGRKQAPNVETNPLYGRGSVDNTAYDSVGPLSNDSDRAPSVCEMTDNIIYE
ncbi:hypothetical protein Bbelb_358480 [Branchiostoma belcheri]|nr:hypothetical protein Bbelb_358480 [Branchiostoma belcheri]